MDKLIDSEYITIDNMQKIEKKLNLILDKLEENNKNILDINNKIHILEDNNKKIINIEILLKELDNFIKHLYNKLKLFSYFPYFYKYI